ncbi:6-phosphofructokinase [Litchfieldia alkalitelluris]|uniref:6-phosphofructokinase n=1 Tax=Litchfieldia alkalitelluris TaxID=304268 RepID=UPI000996F122|nr:6-phosphofructokinase [Litchfieldia alkalitelluris]
MKIGVVHFGSFTTGITEIIRTLINEKNDDIVSLYGIEWNRQSDGIEVRELHKVALDKAQYTSEAILNSFPEHKWTIQNSNKLQPLSEFDTVIVFGGKNHQIDLPYHNILFIPVSIFNDIEDSSYSLGYDSALNTIYNSIEKIRDTASSLLYGRLRVFPIQVPGNEFTPLIEDTALAVNSPFVKKVDEQAISNIKEAILEKNSRNETYMFIIMDYSIDHQSLEKSISKDLLIDWKVMSISESQCVGPYPTARDQVSMRKVSQTLLELIRNGIEPGQLNFQGNKLFFKKNNLIGGNVNVN